MDTHQDVKGADSVDYDICPTGTVVLNISAARLENTVSISYIYGKDRVVSSNNLENCPDKITLRFTPRSSSNPAASMSTRPFDQTNAPLHATNRLSHQSGRIYRPSDSTDHGNHSPTDTFDYRRRLTRHRLPSPVDRHNLAPLDTSRAPQIELSTNSFGEQFNIFAGDIFTNAPTTGSNAGGQSNDPIVKHSTMNAESIVLQEPTNHSIGQTLSTLTDFPDANPNPWLSTDVNSDTTSFVWWGSINTHTQPKAEPANSTMAQTKPPSTDQQVSSSSRGQTKTPENDEFRGLLTVQPGTDGRSVTGTSRPSLSRPHPPLDDSQIDVITPTKSDDVMMLQNSSLVSDEGEQSSSRDADKPNQDTAAPNGNQVDIVKFPPFFYESKRGLGGGTYNISKSDKLVIVMGPTGTGKSTLIDYAVGGDGSFVGHDLKSKTDQIILQKVVIGNQSVVLVDTPGFDDTNNSDYTTLSKIAAFLMEAKGNGLKLDKLLYLHRMTDNRMAGAPLRNLELFASLSGNIAMPRVTIVTTMGNLVKEKIVEERLENLKTGFWSGMIAKKAKIRDFEGSTASARAIILESDLESEQDKTTPLLSHELVTKRRLLEHTEAGRTLNKQLERLLLEREKAQRRLNQEINKRETSTAKEFLRAELHALEDKTSELISILSHSKAPFTIRLSKFFFREATPAIQGTDFDTEDTLYPA
ncbi:hypothetical protein FRC17_003632 [Serendipita sp. 399]|nr:hypothetical protein FRC17_003632 [Serendipita sp. 399]